MCHLGRVTIRPLYPLSEGKHAPKKRLKYVTCVTSSENRAYLLKNNEIAAAKRKISTKRLKTLPDILLMKRLAVHEPATIANAKITPVIRSCAVNKA